MTPEQRAFLREWAHAERNLADVKADGGDVRSLIPAINTMRRTVREMRIVGDSLNDRLISSIFGGEPIDLNQWRKYL